MSSWKLPLFCPYVCPTVVHIIWIIDIELFSYEKPTFLTLIETGGTYLTPFKTIFCVVWKDAEPIFGAYKSGHACSLDEAERL